MNVAVFGEQTVWLTGWVVTAGPVYTVNALAFEVALPQVFVATAVYVPASPVVNVESVAPLIELPLSYH